MPLTSFPNQIRVTLGSAFNGTNGLDPGDVLILTKVSGQDDWTEDGTDVPNTSTNRIRVEFNCFLITYSPSSAGRNREVVINAAATDWATGAVALGISTGNPTTLNSTYIFKSLWNEGGLIFQTRFVTDNTIFTTTGTTLGQSYNDTIFSSLDAYVPGDLQVLDGEDVIADGEETPIDFGTVEVGGDAPSKTFTVENIGGNTITISDTSVPDGFEITSALPGTIAAAGSAELTVAVSSTATADTFSGDIEITSDDPDEGTYNFAITTTIEEVEEEEEEMEVTTVIDYGPENVYPKYTFQVNTSGTVNSANPYNDISLQQYNADYVDLHVQGVGKVRNGDKFSANGELALKIKEIYIDESDNPLLQIIANE